MVPVLNVEFNIKVNKYSCFYSRFTLYYQVKFPNQQEKLWVYFHIFLAFISIVFTCFTLNDSNNFVGITRCCVLFLFQLIYIFIIIIRSKLKLNYELMNTKLLHISGVKCEKKP